MTGVQQPPSNCGPKAHCQHIAINIPSLSLPLLPSLKADLIDQAKITHKTPAGASIHIIMLSSSSVLSSCAGPCSRPVAVPQRGGATAIATTARSHHPSATNTHHQQQQSSCCLLAPSPHMVWAPPMSPLACMRCYASRASASNCTCALLTSTRECTQELTPRPLSARLPALLTHKHRWLPLLLLATGGTQSQCQHQQLAALAPQAVPMGSEPCLCSMCL